MSGKRSHIRIEASIRLAVLSCLLVTSIVALSQSSPQSSEEQPKPSATNAGPVQEFPVTMRQNVVAGKTPVGTKVEARLTIATLIRGAVIPEGASFSGEVVESVAKSLTDPSRLSIRMDSVRWKKESRPMRLFLTAWYYPLLLGEDAAPKDRDNAPPSVMQNPNTPGFPNPHTPPDLFPQASRLSETRVTMKDVESSRADDGTITLTSNKSNLKLDKSTTYVFSNGDLGAPAKPPSASDHTK